MANLETLWIEAEIDESIIPFFGNNLYYLIQEFERTFTMI